MDTHDATERTVGGVTGLVMVCAIAVVGVGGVALRGRLTAPRHPWTTARRVRRARGRRTRRPAADDRRLAGWCEAAAGEVRAGSSLVRAIERASTDDPIASSVFEPVIDAVRRGRPLPAALEAMDTEPSGSVAVVVAVLRACASLGGPAAPPLERAAATLHGRADAAAERWAHSAQARLSARVLTVLPGAALALLAAGEPAIRAVLATPAGVGCVITGVTLNGVGAWWMRRIIGRPT